jgi:hypothetical protein
MGTCLWAGCEVPVPQPKRGRPRKYCPEHAREAKRQQDNARWTRKADGSMPHCCQDWALSGPRRKVCPQHQQWRLFAGQSWGYRPSQRHSNAESEDELTILDLERVVGCRVSEDPDSYYPPEPGLMVTHDTKFGRDGKAEQAAERIFSRERETM